MGWKTATMIRTMMVNSEEKWEMQRLIGDSRELNK